MPPRYGLEPRESCAGCDRGRGRPFCVPGANGGLDSPGLATVYPKGAVLFVEGQPPRGVYVLCSGRVKLSTSSGEARVLITHLAGPGEVLGLAAVVSGRPYEVTAETLEPSQANFVRGDDFARLLSERPEAALRVSEQLAADYRAAFEQARLLGLSATAAGKLARLLLDCAERGGRPSAGGGVAIKLTLTHEELGQLIGASRETVTRLFTELKARRLIEVRGATLAVLDRPGLEAVADA